jgi:hypothetical protein
VLSPFLEWNIIFGCLECIRHVVKDTRFFRCRAEACALSLVTTETLVTTKALIAAAK